MQAIANNDQKAFELLYNKTNARVYNTALSYVQNAQDAEEVTQEVYIKIHKSAKQFKFKSSINTWVYRITINTCLNYMKSSKRIQQHFVDNEKDKPDFDHPGILLENKENAKFLFKAIESLSENQKTAFILSFLEELPRQEVADIMELKLKALESLLQRAKGNLRKKLENMYPYRRKK